MVSGGCGNERADEPSRVGPQHPGDGGSIVSMAQSCGDHITMQRVAQQGDELKMSLQTSGPTCCTDLQAEILSLRGLLWPLSLPGTYAG